MKPRLLELVRETSTAESVYAEKYEWLMRWALHFCNGDKEMAEDLVQDTFVRMVSSWHSIRDIDNPERFLYTYLKYGFLRLRAEDKRQAMHSISVEDIDAVDRLLPEAGPDLLEWQQDICGVVDFLCWRKTTAKSASLLLLRFFHGLFPAEIMQVARMNRKAVDDGLASARHEARTCTKRRQSPGENATRRSIRSATQTTPHVVPPPATTEEFMRQMLELISSAKDGECLSATALGDRYDDRSGAVIDCWLLSHLVSCQRCLDFVLKMHALPPRGTRPLEDILGYAPKAEAARPKKKSAPISAAMRSMAAAQERHRQAIEYRPRTIALMVDGQRLASRDIGSSLNTLTVELRAGEHAELLEIVGDTSLLLSVPVLATPPNAAPLQQFQMSLSNSRSIALAIEFNASGMRLHVTYNDPLFTEAADPVAFAAEESWPAPSMFASLGDESDRSGFRSTLSEWLKRPFRPWLRLSVAFACAGAVCVPVYLYLRRPPLNVVLARAVAATSRQANGVVTQRVHIARHKATSDSSYDTTLHRDLARKLTPSHRQKSSAAQIETERELASAKIDWSDPLSPASFSDWRKEQPVVTDVVTVVSNETLTLTSKSTVGQVLEESLTLDAKTLHAVGKTVRFSDNEVIEIAELNYSVIPLANSNPDWFEPSQPVVSAEPLERPHAAVLPMSKMSAVVVSSEQLDVAELNVRLAMIELHADGQERLTISRNHEGVLVEGLVATDERRREIEKRLRQVAHVRSAIQTFSAFEVSAINRARDHKSSQDNESFTIADASEDLSPLDRLAPERHLSVERLSAIHSSLLEAAIDLRQSATAMRDLDLRFHRDRLDDDGKSLRSNLTRLYTSQMKAATDKVTAALRDLGVRPQEPLSGEDAPLWNVAMANAQLCFELISQRAEDSRSPQTILQELVTSTGTMDRSLQAPAPDL